MLKAPPLPEMVPQVQVRLSVRVTVPVPLRLPALEPPRVRSWMRLRALTVTVALSRTRAPLTWSWWTVTLPEEHVTVSAVGMTTSSLEPGTALPLQFEPVPQLPLEPPTQVTVLAVV